VGWRVRKLAIAIACAAAAALPAVGQAQPLNAASARLLAAQNHERALVGLGPLQWDPALASAAASYGPSLAAIGRLQHSPRETRRGQRENLWRGTRGAFTPEQMIASWAAEKRFFRAGVFPSVSTTGDWEDVAHYTAMVWPTTTRVGCAVHSNAAWDYLICRYSPPGNIDGRALVLNGR